MQSLLDRQLSRMNLPLLALALSYAPFLMAMQYSKHKWLITRPASAWDYFPILHSELFLFGIVALALIRWLPGAWAGYLLLTSYYLISLSDDLTWFAMGRPFHPQDVMRCVELISYYSEFVTIESIGWKRVLYAAVPAAGAAVMLCCRIRGRARRFGSGRLGGALGRGALAAVVLYLLLTPFALSRSYLHYNSMVRIAKQISYDWSFFSRPVTRAEMNRLLGPAPQGHPFAPGRKLNVILYVLETAPADLYPDLAAEFVPYARRNRSALLPLPEHYSTYPESDRSLLSIMTGKYPCLKRGNDWVDSYDYGAPLPKVLQQHGYRSYLLSVAPLSFHRNDVMARNLGFGELHESRLAREAIGEARKKQGKLERRTLYQADEELLEKALEIIRMSRKEPYLLAFTPQASHAPFQVPPGHRGRTGQRDLLEGNARWQFGLIHRIMQELERTGQAQHTLIMIVGDHGLRHPSESALFQDQSVLSPLTFKVACALILPQQLARLQPTVTSHVDITPTVLDLLSISYDSGRYHGRSLAALPSRAVYFLGGDYLPVNGFTANGWYFMENVNRDLVLKSREFRFDRRGGRVEEVTDSGERSGISRDLALMKALLAD